MSTKIIHLSDLHIGNWVEFPQKTIEEDHLKKWVQHIGESYQSDPKPIILITGDLIHDGDPKQYRDAKSLLMPLIESGFIVWPIPGNHDYGRLGNHAKKGRFKYFKGTFFGRDNPHYPHENVTYPQIKQIKKIGGHWLIGLNSMKGELGFTDKWLADGELGEKQLRNTIGVLKDLNKRTPEEKEKEKVILFLHHHPFIFPHHNFLKKGIEKIGHYLKDGEEFMEKITGLVDILLFGHEHEHINFSKTPLSKRYKIPYILSCGKSTAVSSEFLVNKKNIKKQPTESEQEGLLAWEINIDAGKIKVSSLVVET
ncbi:MAG: metallophosphoesterase [Planctomycetes bacterium]|nr:metallophosphoesterase [Planctomycetota bacterium]